MIPGAFDYHRPASIDEAVRLAQFGDDGRVIAGGHSLIPMMKLRLAQPSHRRPRRHRRLVRHQRGRPGVRDRRAYHAARPARVRPARRHCPLLHETALLIADPQVRYCGTIGGNVANGDPGNDMPAVMQCLDATYVVRGPSGERRIQGAASIEAAYFLHSRPTRS